MEVQVQGASSYGSPPGSSFTIPSPTVAPSSPPSAVSSPYYWSDAESYDMADRAPMSEYEEVPSPRWLSPASRWISRGAGRKREATRASPLPAGRSGEPDGYWEGLLPPNYEEIIRRSVRPVEFSSAEELYLCLCDSILVDDGEQSVALDRFTDGKCFTLSAIKLEIASANDDRRWKWISRAIEQDYWEMTGVPDSRFSKVAELLSVVNLEIHGVIDTRELSPRTMYAAFFIFELSYPFGFLGRFQETSITAGGGFTTRHTVCLSPGRGLDSSFERFFTIRVPRRRSDGWKEVEMGEFFVKDGGGGADAGTAVRMSLKGLDGKLMGGLIIQGIEVRPKTDASIVVDSLHNIGGPGVLD